MSHHTFATLIGSRRISGSWQAWLTEQLATRGVRLDGDRIDAGDQLIGFFRFAGIAELSDTEVGAGWARRGERPWAGPPAGVLEWTHTVAPDVGRDRLVPALVELGRGPFARLDGQSDAVLESLVRRRFSLAELLHRRGFEDGAALLRGDREYLDDARATAEAALRAAGLDALVGTWDLHNPLRIAGPVQRGGEPLADPEPLLAAHEIELWVYNWKILAHPTFWLD